jgi:hypothetical protein
MHGGTLGQLVVKQIPVPCDETRHIRGGTLRQLLTSDLNTLARLDVNFPRIPMPLGSQRPPSAVRCISTLVWLLKDPC